MTEAFKLYGTPTSYYTAKVRAYLQYKAIDYREILTTEDVYRDVIVARTGVWMIPTLVTPDDEVIQDSTEIIDALEKRFPQSPIHPHGAMQRLASLLLEMYGDEWLIMTAIHYRWTKDENREFAIAEFGKQAKPDGTATEQKEAGLEKAKVFGGWVDLFGIDAVTGPGIEEAYEEMLSALNAHFLQHAFLFGSRPSIADFSFFGGLHAVLHRDPLSGRLLERLAPNVVAWLERMRHPIPNSGTFLPHDEVPEGLDPILRAVFSDQFPVLRDTIERVGEWARAHPGEAFPKTIGRHAFALRGCQGNRCVYPYPQWMLQRVLACYRSIGPEAKIAVDARLLALGGREQLELNIEHPLERRGFQLVSRICPT